MPRTIDQFTPPSTHAIHVYTAPNGGGGVRGSLGENGLTHTVTWKMDLLDVGAFLNFAWGWSGTTTRGPRLSSPYFTGPVATGIEFEGIGSDSSVSRLKPYTHALVTVTFGWLPFGTDGSQPYVDVRWRGKSTLTSIPNAKTTFSNGEYLDFDSGVWIGSVSVEVTLHQLINWSNALGTLMGLMGKVSSTALTLDGFACPAGTLMIPTFDASKSIASMGSPQQTLTVPFEYRALAWNQAIRSDGVADTVSPAPYLTADFSPLLAVS